MFLADLPEFVVPADPKPDLHGVLVFNGHPNPSVFPTVQGWLKVQREQLHRNVDLCNLDDLVRWITQDRLVADLRAALDDLGLSSELA